MEYLPINDLPNELLEMIFDHLDVDDLKNASLVCKRWLDLAFSGRRMDRVMLVPDFPWDNDLLQSKRKYRHLQLGNTEKCSAHVKELFQAFNFSSLRIEDKNKCISHSSLRSILLEIPNLQQLSIVCEPDQPKKMIEPLPVMRKLERLEIEYNNPESAIHWHTIAPSLQGLKMRSISEHQLEQWRLFSGQLKQVYVICDGGNLTNRFCELTFPLLEELSIKMMFGYFLYVFQHTEFLRRIISLRRLRLDGFFVSKTLVQDITNHNKKLTSLEIIGDNLVSIRARGEPGSLESLAQLTELKHLRLENLNIYIFRGCEALTSLQSLCIPNNCSVRSDKEPLGFLEDLLNIAPQLRCLELGSDVIPASAVHFICDKFTKLTRLQLTYSEKVTSDGLSRIDRLQHLSYLKLYLSNTNRLLLSTIPQIKLRYLTLVLGYQYDGSQILLLPENFPQLERLNLFLEGVRLRESTVDRLRKLLPTCAIITYGDLTTGAGTKKNDGGWRHSREMMPVWEKEWAWRKLYH